MKNTGHSISTLKNFMDDNRGQFLKANHVALKDNIEQVQKYLANVQDIPQRVMRIPEALANMSGSVKEEREQRGVVHATANVARERVQHMESNITNCNTMLTEAAQGYPIMRKDLLGVEKRDYEDIMTCVQGIQEAKDIGLRVIGETQGLQESRKKMHRPARRVKQNVSDLEHQVT